MEKIFDVAIIGGGPAGLSAAIYALRAGLSTCCFETQVLGGQLNQISKLENYPGFSGSHGAELALTMSAQAEKLGLNYIYEEAIGLNLKAKVKTITTASGTFFAKSVILTMGAVSKKLNLKNERNLIGKGVSYCATCDGALYKGANVVVVGNGESALSDALYLEKFASEVVLVCSLNKLVGSQKLVSAVNASQKIKVYFYSTVTELIEENTLKQVKIFSAQTKSETIINASGLFVSMGRGPDTAFLGGQVKTNNLGFIKVNNKMQTNVAGVFAAGDITDGSLKQVVTATADGAIAATSARIYLRDLK